MNFKNKLTLTIAGLFMAMISFSQAKKATEYLGVAGPIMFNKASYNLTWTSHPADNYYKQEYIAKGDNVERFKTLLMIEIITGNTSLREIVNSKILELKKMQATNPVINYQTFEKNGEIMLDFLLSESTPDGKNLSIVERNVYRYKSVVDKKGQKGVLLFGVSERAYGQSIQSFFPALKAHRMDLPNAVGNFPIPEILIAK